MGVKTLWKILDGQCIGQEGQLSDLEGCSVAVDLSGWIVASQQLLTPNRNIRKPHLRDLFLKASHLVRHQVKVVFILDGTAPALKAPELRRRQLARQKYNRSLDENDGGAPTAGRRFQALVDECCELLDALGLPWIKSKGEAEATCAWLNANQIVDGVVSNDSDSFLFGAKIVYKDFSCDQHKVNFRKYTSESITQKLTSRKGLVALAILLGSDYDTAGVTSIGKEQAVKLLQHWNNKDPLQRFKEWRENSKLNRLESYKTLKKPTHCGKCQHLGSVTSHKKEGCPLCKTTRFCVECKAVQMDCDCEFHHKKSQYNKYALEIKIRREALKDQSFPNQEIIEAFMNPVGAQCDVPSLCWKPPKLLKLQGFLSQHLNWSSDHFTTRVCPLLVSSALYHDTLEVQAYRTPEPVQIIKQRTRNGQQFYEVQWTNVCVLSPVDPVFSSPDNPITEIVPVGSFSRRYPNIVKDYAQTQNVKKSESKKKNTKPKSDGPTVGRQPTMDKFFKFTKQVNRTLFQASPPAGTSDSPDITDLTDEVPADTHKNKSKTTGYHPPMNSFGSKCTKAGGSASSSAPFKHKLTAVDSDSDEADATYTSTSSSSLGTPKKMTRQK